MQRFLRANVLIGCGQRASAQIVQQTLWRRCAALNPQRCPSSRTMVRQYCRALTVPTRAFSGPSSQLGAVDVVTAVDAFSQGRVANVVRRLKDASSRESDTQVTVERVTILEADVPPALKTLVDEGSSVVQLWRCSTTYSIYVPNHGMTTSPKGGGGGGAAPFVLLEVTAVGMSRDERMATQAAAMHAERLLDHNGVHIFALPRMQENHAKSARAHRRWAPLPTEGRDDVPASAVCPLPVLIPGEPQRATSATTTGKQKKPNPFGTPVVAAAQSKHSVSHEHRRVPSKDARYTKQRAHEYVTTMRTLPLLPLKVLASIAASSPMAGVDDRLSSCTVFRNTDDWTRADDRPQHANAQTSSPTNAAAVLSSNSPVELFEAFHKAAAEVIDPEDVCIVEDSPNSNSSNDRASGAPFDAPLKVPRDVGAAGLPPTALHRKVGFVTNNSNPTATTKTLASFELVEDDDRFELEGLPNLMCLRDANAYRRLSDACSATYATLLSLNSDGAAAETIPLSCLDVRKAMQLDVLYDGNVNGSDDVAVTMPVPALILLMGAVVLQSAVLRDTWANELTAAARRECVEEWMASSSTCMVTAMGVAPTRDVAEELCAMHAERLLEQLGVPLFAGCHDAVRDAALHDACLRYGRRRGTPLLTKYELDVVLPNAYRHGVVTQPRTPSPGLFRSVSTAVATMVNARYQRLGARTLQRPLRSFPRRNDVAVHSTHNRLARKHEVLSMHGMLLHLNRVIINTQRIHVLEIDLDDKADWLLEAEEDLRNFFIEQNLERSAKRTSTKGNDQSLALGAELCYVNFTYTPDAQYRCSIFLPVGKEFGVRGGYAVGVTATSAKRLCALHALDVLCAIGVPVYRDPQRQAAFLAKRSERGLIQPASTPLHDVRSPPGYRELPGAATTTIPSAATMWRVMMTDATEFDVVRSVEHFYLTNSTSPQQPQRTSHSPAPPVSKPFSPYGKQDEITVLRTMVSATLDALNISAKDRLVATCLLASDQHLQRRRRLAANNMWLTIPTAALLKGSKRWKSNVQSHPFPPEIVAWGRCFHRKGAERAMLIHLLRLLMALEVDIARSLQNGSLLVEAFRKVHGRPEDGRGHDQPSPTQRGGALTDTSVTFSPLPCPVMTHELAIRTFV